MLKCHLYLNSHCHIEQATFKHRRGHLLDLVSGPRAIVPVAQLTRHKVWENSEQRMDNILVDTYIAGIVRCTEANYTRPFLSIQSRSVHYSACIQYHATTWYWNCRFVGHVTARIRGETFDNCLVNWEVS